MMTRNPKLKVIIGLSILLVLGVGIIVLLIMDSSGVDPLIATGPYVQETNEAVSTYFAQTSTHLTLTPPIPNDTTHQLAATTTPPSEVELVPIPSPTFAPTVSPN